MNQHLCTVLLIIAVTSNCGDLVSALGCDELDDSSEYTEMCQGSTVKHPYCPPGKRLIYPCEGICDYCPTGQYQDKHNTCETCRNCTTQADCDRFEHVLISQCKSDTDAKCGCPTYPTCETCPPVEPEKGCLRILGIISTVGCILLLLGYPILYLYLRKVHKPKGYDGIAMNDRATEDHLPNNDATLPEESGQGPSPLRGAKGGDPSPVATPPDGSDQGPSPPQGAEGGDPTPVNGDAAHRPLLEGNGATVPANPQGANDQQWQFEPEDLGGELVEDQELSLLASSIAKLHAGKAFNDVRLFCSQLGIHDSVYNPVLIDRRQSNNEEKLYYVFVAWLMETSLKRNSLCRALLKFDKLKKTCLCNLYVDIVQECLLQNSTESS